MQQHWLNRSNSGKLIIYVLGWASTPDAVAHIHTPGYDILCLYDYRSITPLTPEDFSGYSHITLFAWSFGVWVSERIASGLPLARAIALNGTPLPVSDEYGMRLRVVLRTMQGLKRVGMAPFNEKTYGGLENMPALQYPDRSIDEKIDELNYLAEQAKADSTPIIPWDKAYIADQDEIFPPAKMEAYWHSRGLGTPFHAYHYPFADPAIVLNELPE